MHEIGIARDILNQLKDYKNIKSITVEVGDLAHISANEMKSILETLTHYQINIKSKKAIIDCECGFKGEPDISMHSHDLTLYSCPTCAKKLPKIIDGDKIILQDVEID